jgi:hypothetical protein
MSAVLVPLLLVVLVLVIGAVAVVRMSRRTQEREDRAKSGETDALRYRVPEGQDPVAVMTALRGDGFEPVQDTATAGRDVLIPCPAGKDRERARVRAIIEHVAPLNLEGDPADTPPVRFADE